MLTTSDQQLQVMGIKRLEDLPKRHGAKFRGVLRDGSSVPCEVFECRDGSFTITGDFDVIARHVSAESLIGWRL